MKCISGSDAIIIDRDLADYLVEMINSLVVANRKSRRTIKAQYPDGFRAWQELKDATMHSNEA